MMEYKFVEEKFKKSFNAKSCERKSADSMRLTHKADNQFKLFPYKASGKTQAPIVTDLQDVVSGFFAEALNKKTEPIDYEDLCVSLLDEVEIEEEFNKKIEEGYVISQETEPNTEVPAGTKVKIKVSKGIEKAVVPNVVGKPKDEAIEMLTKDEMFTITATLTEQDTTKADGTILKQSLDAGTEVEKGSNITITVNQIEKIVEATATINLKSVMNYNSQNTNTTNNSVNNGIWNTTTDTQGKNVAVKLMVGNDIVYNQTHKTSETNINVKFSGIGTVAVKLYVDDVGKDTKQINLSNTKTVTNE